MKQIIPGHVKGFTWLLAFVVCLTAYIKTYDWMIVFGILLVVVGAFLGDQATHLAQEDHSAPPPTWLEQKQQQHRYVFVVLGLLIASLGTALIAS